MSLLPNNSSLKDQKFAELFDIKSRVDYSDLKIDVMSCDKSILPHVALKIGANIDNMLESEARKYLSTFTKKAVGTVGAVEDAISSTLDNAQLVEWHQDKENLAVGFFGVTVQVQNDESIKYDERLFYTSKRVIKENKNVRSKFDSFNLAMPLIGTNTYIAFGRTSNLKLKNDLAFKQGQVQINIQGAGIWTV
jgi:P2-related tail formation protein